MPTSYSDQFYLVDPYSPPAVGTVLTMNFLGYVDSNDDGILTVGGTDSINGQDITGIYNGDTVTVNIGGTNVTVVGVTFYTAGGGRYFTATDGTNLSDGKFVSSTWVNSPNSVNIPALGPPCFVAGSVITTPDGDICVEDLNVGDLVHTLDHGAQEIRWIGCSEVDGTGRHAPIVFKAGSIGNDTELKVSPQHRILMQGWRAELFFGDTEVLIPAKHLLNGDDIIQEPVDSVKYFHVMFDAHEIITANGVLSESFFPGDQMLLQDRAIRAELAEVFGHVPVLVKTARPTIKAREAQVLQHVA